MPLRSRPALLMTLVWLMPAMAQAGAWPHHWRVTELQPNEPVVGGVWYRAGSPLDRGMNVGDGYVALYVVEAEPGAQYTLQLKAPHSLKRIRAYVFDRWPGTAGVHSTPLPTGPAMIPAHARYVTYRWRVISNIPTALKCGADRVRAVTNPIDRLVSARTQIHAQAASLNSSTA
jgi:hypothetical protein